MSLIHPQQLIDAFVTLLDETFDQVHGYYLDVNTSLFETLADISAEDASIPVGGNCATLAAQVKHTAFYLEFVAQSVREPNSPQADWDEIWRTVNIVAPDEWLAIQAELRTNYQQILELIKTTPNWGANEIGGAIGVIAHTAYHLGEIRQALCCIRS